jgi:type IV pilus assembly protein PilM
MPDAEIESAVPFEAESYIPIPIEQVYLDWMKIGEKDGKTALLLVASPKAFVDQVLEGLDGAGLRPTALEVESLAIARSLIPFGSPDNILIADMRTSKTDLIIVEKGVVQFTSTIPVAGVSITDSIAKGLEVPTKRAEEIKTEAGFGNTEDYPNLKTLVMPVLNTFLTEIKQVLAFHDQHSAVRVGKIVLAGGAAKLKHLDEFFKSGLESEYPELLVEVGDPTVNLHLQFPEKLSGIEVITYTTAIGLAMKGLKT